MHLNMIHALTLSSIVLHSSDCAVFDRLACVSGKYCGGVVGGLERVMMVMITTYPLLVFRRMHWSIFEQELDGSGWGPGGGGRIDDCSNRRRECHLLKRTTAKCYTSASRTRPETLA